MAATTGKVGKSDKRTSIVPLLTDHPPYVHLPGPQQMRNLVHGFGSPVLGKDFVRIIGEVSSSLPSCLFPQ